MTTWFESIETCGFCSKEVSVASLGSTNAFGASDLDGRPPQMERDAMLVMQHCELCGYFGYDITREIPAGKREAIASLLTQLAKHTEPQRHHARYQQFQIAAEMESILTGEPEVIGLYYLRAAWCADDAHEANYFNDTQDFSSIAQQMRKLALKHFALSSLGNIEAWMVMCDVARRAGEKSQALKLLDKLPTIDAHECMSEFITYQRKLLQEDDDKCHTVDEMVG